MSTGATPLPGQPERVGEVKVYPESVYCALCGEKMVLFERQRRRGYVCWSKGCPQYDRTYEPDTTYYQTAKRREKPDL